MLFNVIKDYKNMADIEAYVPAFKYICRSDATFYNATSYYKMQIGYYWLNKLIGYVSTSHYWFMFAVGCITALPYAMLIKKYSPLVWMSCLLYFMGFSQSTFVLRQHSAIGLTILILPLLLLLPDDIRKIFKGMRNKILCILILILFISAILIHPTAIIFAFVFYAYFVKNIKVFMTITLGGGLVLYQLLPIFTFIFVENTAGYQTYMVAENENKGGTIIINGFYLLATLYALRPYRQLPKQWYLLLKTQCIIFTFSFVSMASGGGVAIPRLLIYLTCFNCVFLPYVATKMPNKTARYTFVVAVFFIAYYLFALSSKINYSNYNIDKSLIGFGI